MVEAGADEVPEETLLEALELAHDGDPQALRGAGGPARAGRQAEVARPELTAELERDARRTRSGERIQRDGLREAGAIVEELVERALPRALDGLDRGGHRRASCRCASSLNAAAREAAARRRRGAGARAVRERPARAHRGRAGLEGAEVGEAAAALRADHRDRRAAVPGRPGDGRRRGAGGQGLADEAVRQAGGRGDLQGPRPQEDRRREAPPGRPRHRGDPPDRRARSASPRARTAPALFTRGQTQIMSLLTLGTAKEGQRIDDLSLETGAPVHAPLQLPALLGRGDGLHARPEAARHRPRRARAAGARGRSSRRPRTSRTRSGSSPRRSSRTARRRWARSAARRSR